MQYAVAALWLGAVGFAAAAGGVLLRRRRGPAGTLMGASALVLALSGLCWLAPRALGLFFEGNWVPWQGLGRLLAGLGLTVWPLLLYRIWELVFRPEARDRTLLLTLWGFAALRLVLCLMPQNRWLENEVPILWATLRTAALGGMTAPIVVCFRLTRPENRALRQLWLFQLAAFLCFFPGALGIGPAPELFLTGAALCQAGTLTLFLRFTK